MQEKIEITDQVLLLFNTIQIIKEDNSKIKELLEYYWVEVKDALIEEIVFLFEKDIWWDFAEFIHWYEIDDLIKISKDEILEDLKEDL